MTTRTLSLFIATVTHHRSTSTVVTGNAINITNNTYNTNRYVYKYVFYGMPFEREGGALRLGASLTITS